MQHLLGGLRLPAWHRVASTTSSRRIKSSYKSLVPCRVDMILDQIDQITGMSFLLRTPGSSAICTNAGIQGRSTPGPINLKLHGLRSGPGRLSCGTAFGPMVVTSYYILICAKVSAKALPQLAPVNFVQAVHPINGYRTTCGAVLQRAAAWAQ